MSEKEKREERLAAALRENLRRRKQQARQLDEGKKDEALAMMREATGREVSMAVEFGPPVVIKPTHELYGEMLLDAAKPPDSRGRGPRCGEA